MATACTVQAVVEDWKSKSEPLYQGIDPKILSQEVKCLMFFLYSDTNLGIRKLPLFLNTDISAHCSSPVTNVLLLTRH
jgi:hypothetical protein